MKPRVTASQLALALALIVVPPLGGCFRETALDRHLFGRIKDASGRMAAPLGPQAPIVAPAGDPAPPLRDPAVTATGIPRPPAGSAAPATPAAPTASP